jgi:hypothetical protein
MSHIVDAPQHMLNKNKYLCAGDISDALIAASKLLTEAPETSGCIASLCNGVFAVFDQDFATQNMVCVYISTKT